MRTPDSEGVTHGVDAFIRNIITRIMHHPLFMRVREGSLGCP
jgi:hypothetical protein